MVQGDAWDTRFLYAVVPVELMVKESSLDYLLKSFVGHLNELQEGVLSDGAPIAGECEFLFAGGTGDMEWMWQAYELKNYYRATLMCPACMATKSATSDLLWTNLAEDAMWRSTSVSTEDFKQHAIVRGGRVPATCGIAGWSMDSMLFDVMHIMYLGCCNDACGSAMYLLVRMRFFANSAVEATQLRQAHVCLRAFCRRKRVKCDVGAFDPLGLGFGKRSFPYLDAKAATLKVIVCWLAHELYTASIVGDDDVKRAAALFHALSEFIQVLSLAQAVMSRSEADRAVLHGTRYLVIYKDLAVRAYLKNQALWKLRPKTHYLHHIIIKIGQTKFNPRYWSCFMDEDYMGKIKVLASHTHRSCVMRVALSIRHFRRSSIYCEIFPARHSTPPPLAICFLKRLSSLLHVPDSGSGWIRVIRICAHLSNVMGVCVCVRWWPSEVAP